MIIDKRTIRQELVRTPMSLDAVQSKDEDRRGRIGLMISLAA